MGRSCVVVAVAAVLVGGLSTAMAVPTTAQTAEDRAALARAVEEYEAAQARASDADARMAQATQALDRAVAEEARARATLQARAASIYRTPDIDVISVMLGASSFQDFMTRWDMMLRIARQDAETLRQLKAAHAQAKRSAEELLDLQAAQARALDEAAAEVSRAKKELATSEAALRAYEAAVAAREGKARAAASAARSQKGSSPSATDPMQQLRGTGAWQTGVASHYGRNFSGIGANGERIGPYSMIVAHKTLPFGTLIEFEYNGKRAVAEVADRGPYTAGRDFDLGPGVVRVLGFSGVHEIRYRIIVR